jgi:hypothetical protein
MQAVTRRQVTTFFKQTVVGNHYSCLQNVVREQFLGQRGGRRRRGNNRYQGGENQRYLRGGKGGGKSTSRNTGTRRGFRGGAAKPTAIGRGRAAIGRGRAAGRRRGRGTTRASTGRSNGKGMRHDAKVAVLVQQQQGSDIHRVLVRCVGQDQGPKGMEQ